VRAYNIRHNCLKLYTVSGVALRCKKQPEKNNNSIQEIKSVKNKKILIDGKDIKDIKKVRKTRKKSENSLDLLIISI
jgi:hypothetical protein